MSKHPCTRYFLFTKLKPKVKDYILLKEECERIDANVIFKTDTSDGDCKVLKGLIILCGNPTYGGLLCNNFPNFLLWTLPVDFELDFWNLPPDVIKIGRHPFESIKRRLFELVSLSEFIKHDRKHIKDI